MLVEVLVGGNLLEVNEVGADDVGLDSREDRNRRSYMSS